MGWLTSMIRAMKQFCSLRGDDLGSLMNVGRGETEDRESGVEEQVLPAIVFNQPVTVIGAVVLDYQAGGGVEQIGTADEPPPGVVKVGLHLGTG